MELVQINSLDAQALQRLLTRSQNMLGGKIVTKWSICSRLAGFANPALRSDKRPFAHAGDFLENFAEKFFGNSVAVNVRMIEECVARLVCRDHRLFSGCSAL